MCVCVYVWPVMLSSASEPQSPLMMEDRMLSNTFRSLEDTIRSLNRRRASYATTSSTESTADYLYTQTHTSVSCEVLVRFAALEGNRAHVLFHYCFWDTELSVLGRVRELCWCNECMEFTCAQVVSQQIQHPLCEQTRGEEIMTVIIHGESSLHLKHKHTPESKVTVKTFMLQKKSVSNKCCSFETVILELMIYYYSFW